MLRPVPAPPDADPGPLLERADLDWYKGGRRARRSMPARDLAQSDVALIAGFGDHLALERHLAPSTVDAYRRDLSQLAAFLRRTRRDLPGAEIDDLRRFVAQLTSLGYARASIARRVGAIHTFYRWSVSRDLVA